MNEPRDAVAVLVERDHLHERHADAVGEAAVHLPLDDHRVDARAAVVDRDEAPDLHLAGARVDVDDADVGPEGVGQVRRVVDHGRVEVALDALGQLEGAVREHRDLLDRPALPRVALDVPAADGPTRGPPGRVLERRRRDDLGLLAHPLGDDRRGGAGHRRRARAVGAQAERRVVGVAVDDLDVLGRDAELVGDDLGERRLVALPLGLHRQPDLGLAGRVHAQLAAVGHAEPEDVHVLARPRADPLGEEAQTDAHQLAAARAAPPARVRRSS